METVMKKLFVLFLTLFTSAILFFSCDPHAEGNTVTINIDAEAIKSIFNNNRAADSTNYGDAYFYARLIGSEGTIYEKTAYFQWPPDGGLYSEKKPSTQLTFTGVTYRETYNLYVYIVHEGQSVAFGSREPFVLNRFGPTREPITLIPQEGGGPGIPSFYMYPPSNQDPNGNYTVIQNGESHYKVTNQAKIEFKAETQGYEGKIFDFYIIHNGKQTNLKVPLVTDSDDDMNVFDRYIFTYTFKEEGDYKIACRVTDPDTHLFATAYYTVKLRSNKMNTDFMIYSADSGLRATTKTSFSDMTDITETYTNTSPSEAGGNPFDFCFDGDMNYYITDGNNIFKNPDYTIDNQPSPFLSPNTNEIKVKKINCDVATNTFILLGTKQYINSGFGIYKENRYSLNYNWFNKPETNGNYTLVNATIHTTVENDFNYTKAYLFYQYSDVYSKKSYLMLYVHSLIEKPGTGIFTISDEPIEKYRIIEKQYPESASNHFDVGDIVILDNKLYFLVNVNNKQAGAGTYKFEYIDNFGFIGKIDLKTMNISLTGVSNLTTITETENDFNNTKYYYISDVNKFISNSKEKNLASPQKFIAIKPKELVIADDGYMFWLDNNEAYYKNLNRVVTVNLSSFAITNVEILNNIKWKFEATGNLSSLNIIYLAN